VSKIFLIILAPVTFFLSYDQILHPSISVALFAQNGVYGLFSATFVPILLGVFAKEVNKTVVFLSSITALAVHFGMFYGQISMYYNNPAVTATIALFCSIIVAAAGMFITQKGARS
jgi:hypothetical protein